MNLKGAVEKFVREATAASDGQFLILNNKGPDPILFFPDFTVSNDRIYQIGAEEYVVCADMTSSEGLEYDLDFILHSAERENPQVRDIIIHRVGESSRYVWEPAGEFTERRPLQ